MPTEVANVRLHYEPKRWLHLTARSAAWRLAISKVDLNNSKPPRRDSSGESSESVSGEREFRGL